MKLFQQTVYECKKSIIRWDSVRWNKNTLLNKEHPLISNQNAFLLSNDEGIQSLLRNTPPNVNLRGYLGTQLDGSLWIVLLNAETDLNISLNPQGYYSEALYITPYIYMENIDTIIEDIDDAELKEKVLNWQTNYRDYILSVTSRAPNEDDGLVKVFDIPTSDLLDLFIENQDTYAIGFFGLKDNSMSVKAIDLIFHGIKDKKQVQTLNRNFAEFKAVAPQDDDFTTPRPPFTSSASYGML